MQQSQSECGALLPSQLLLSPGGCHLGAKEECLEGVAKSLPISVISQKEREPELVPGRKSGIRTVVYQQHHLAILESLASVKKRGRGPKQ